MVVFHCRVYLVVSGLLTLMLVSVQAVAASAYDTPLSNAASYLANTQNTQDGSWGTTDNLKPLYTAEAVQALRAYNQRTRAYYAGITWLENHRTPNVDYTARRVMALSANGDDLSADATYLVNAQNISASGNNGWGVSPNYQGANLDTALTLQALASITSSADTTKATTYLQSQQLTGTDTGWPLAQEATSDVITTAQAIIALTPKLGATNAVITKGITALRAKVSTSSPVTAKALAALAYLTVNSTSMDAVTLLNNLKAIQAADGSIGGDAYTTSISMRAFALSAGKDLITQRDLVTVTDQNLRNAINAALGKNAMDNINKGELANLFSLDISGRGVNNLTGLEWAVNLTSLNAKNNNITSKDPIKNLPNLVADLTGNPVANTGGSPSSGDVPTLPEWGEIMFGLLLLLILFKQRRAS
jgi:hypothetical protein